MHAIQAYFIRAIDAGRHALSNTSRTVPGSFRPDLAILMRVAESPVQLAVRKLYDAKCKIRIARRSALRKVAQLAHSANPIGRESRAATAQRLVELTSVHEAACLIAFHEENEKNRRILKSIMYYWTPEFFESIFPHDTQFISDAWAKETADRLWDELVSASRRRK